VKGALPLHIHLVSNTLSKTHVLQIHIYIEKALKFLHFLCLMPKVETVLGQSKRIAPPHCFPFSTCLEALLLARECAAFKRYDMLVFQWVRVSAPAGCSPRGPEGVVDSFGGFLFFNRFCLIFGRTVGAFLCGLRGKPPSLCMEQ
jgi:hypothetical protein